MEEKGHDVLKVMRQVVWRGRGGTGIESMSSKFGSLRSRAVKVAIVVFNQWSIQTNRHTDRQPD